MAMRMEETIIMSTGFVEITSPVNTTTMTTAVLLRIREIAIVIWASDCMLVAGVPLRIALSAPPP